MNRKKRALVASACTGVALLSLAAIGAVESGCELIVQLDRSLADAGTEDVVLGVCPICTSLEDGSADANGRARDDSAADADVQE